MKRLLIALAFLLSLSAARAGDVAEFRPLGFSESGQYYAFAQMGTQDGSGFPYAEVSVLDVQKNEQVGTGSVVLSEEKDGSLGTPEQALRKAIASAKLEKFSITRGEHPGTDLLVRLPTDHGCLASAVFSFEALPEGGASGLADRYEARIETTRTEPALKDVPADFGPAFLMKLSIVGQGEAKDRVQVLQEDKRLPKSRAYPLTYTVRRVTAFKDGLVVIVSYTTPGFEGPNVRYIAVSGRFPATPTER